MRLALMIAALLPALAWAGDMIASGLSRTLSGVDGTSARVTLVRDVPAAGSIVTVCLSIPADHRRPKALAAEARAPIRVLPGQERCLPLAPARHGIVLSTEALAGGLQRSMAFTADLTGYAGRIVRIEWGDEAPE